MVLFITFFNQSGSDILLQYRDGTGREWQSLTLKNLHVVIQENNLYRYWKATTLDTNRVILQFRTPNESANYIIPSSGAVLSDLNKFGDMHINN